MLSVVWTVGDALDFALPKFNPGAALFVNVPSLEGSFASLPLSSSFSGSWSLFSLSLFVSNRGRELPLNLRSLGFRFVFARDAGGGDDGGVEPGSTLSIWGLDNTGDGCGIGLKKFIMDPFLMSSPCFGGVLVVAAEALGVDGRSFFSGLRLSLLEIESLSEVRCFLEGPSFSRSGVAGLFPYVRSILVRVRGWVLVPVWAILNQLPVLSTGCHA